MPVMASIGSYVSLAPPVTEDTMEMSSPANRADDDIEIDFGEYTDNGQEYDEHMLEEGQTRPGTGTDDLMEDDSLPIEQAVVQEEDMQDDYAQDAPLANEGDDNDDDELIDYGDEAYQDEPREDHTITAISASGNEQAAQTDSSFPTIAVDEAAQGVPETASVPDVSSSTDLLLPSSDNAQELTYGKGDHDATLANSETAEISVEHHEQVKETQGEHELNSVGESADSPQDNTPGTPTDTGLHPMTIRYGDMSIPLFKSQRQPDGLLKDDNLASLSLAELMKNCRQRLAIKTGENLSEDQELHLGFDRLGLLLVEDSRMAFESSLNDILEVYLQLQRNDGVDEIPALSLTLSLQLKFASSLSILKQAAASGQGMSTFGFLNMVDEDEDYQEHHELGENAELAGEEYTKQEFHEQTVTDPANDEYLEEEDFTEEYQEYDHTEGAPGEFEEAYYHEDLDYHQDEHSENENDQANPGSETIPQGEQQQPLHALYNAPYDSATTSAGTQETDLAALPSSVNQRLDQTGFETISATAEKDTGIDNSIPASADQEDFSNFLTDFGEEEAGENATAKGVQQILGGGEAAAENTSIPADEHTVGVDNNTHDQNHEFEDEDLEPGENEAEAEHNPTDTFDGHHEELHLPHDPDADHGQLNASQAFSNGDPYEHGAEHDVYEEGEEDVDDTVETVVHHAVDEREATESDEDDFDFEEAVAPTDHSDLHESGSLSGKRSFDDFDEHAEYHFGDEERDIKKARAV